MPRHDHWLSILVADPSVLIRKRRHLLCRPAGGLTDMLSQISVCMAYARHHDRCLIIDTDILDFVAEPASNHFFVSHQLRSRPHLSLSPVSHLNSLSCVPRSIQGRMNHYSAAQVPWGQKDAIRQSPGHFTNLRDVESSAPLSFNFRVPYPKESSQDIRRSG